jgi:glucose-1-phosphate cytidylyltransferase
MGSTRQQHGQHQAGSIQMQAVILAGGQGSRLSEETTTRPKPMVSVGGRPLLWHLMKNLGAQGITDFVICCGYKGYMIKEYFAHYFLHNADFAIDLKNNVIEAYEGNTEPWRVSVIDTGERTQTGGRLRRIRHLLDNEPFLMTYGDGLADVDLASLTAFHASHGALATVTAVQPAGRFGALETDGDRVLRFTEKPQGDGMWVNGGYFVLHPSALDTIDGDETAWEGTPVQRLADAGSLMTFRHRGFWQPMDTLRDRQYLEQLWDADRAPWRTW